MPRDASASPSPRKAFADRRRDPATKREAVLKTAAQLFLEKSYGRTSMNDVADRLNITKPALYHYFDNKEDILLECYRLGVGLIEETLNEIAAHCGNGLQKVEAFIHSYAMVMTANFGRCVMRLDEGDLTSDARAEVRTYKTKNRPPLAFVHPGRDRGWIDCAVRYQDRRVFHCGRAELDLHVVRTRWRPVSGRDCRSVRAHLDAGAGRPEAKQQVAHRYQRGVIRMSV